MMFSAGLITRSRGFDDNRGLRIDMVIGAPKNYTSCALGLMWIMNYAVSKNHLTMPRFGQFINKALHDFYSGAQFSCCPELEWSLF